mgnify:CR=1 FL=1
MEYALPESKLEELRTEAKIKAYLENYEKLEEEGYEESPEDYEEFSMLKEVEFQELLSERHERLYE